VHIQAFQPVSKIVITYRKVLRNRQLTIPPTVIVKRKKIKHIGMIVVSTKTSLTIKLYDSMATPQPTIRGYNFLRPTGIIVVSTELTNTIKICHLMADPQCPGAGNNA